jgi:hypothetical protein
MVYYTGYCGDCPPYNGHITMRAARLKLPFTIQANYAGRYWRGAAPPMFNRPLRTAAPLCGSAAAPRGIFDSQRGLVTPAKGRRDCYRRHVRRGRSHFCDGKPSRARETRAIPQMSTRAKMTSLQICRIAVAPLRLRAGATSPGASCGCQPGAAGDCP